MKKIIISSIILVSGFYSLKAQQDAMFTHYMYNTLAVNPAYAGSRQALTLTGLHRSQWTGFDGAPTTQTFTLHTPLFKENFGVGLSFLNDKIGPVSTTSLFADLAYHLKLNDKSKLAVGLKAGFNARKASLADLKTISSNDVAFASNTSSNILPNVGLGLYYYREKFYAGISSPSLLQNDFNTNTTFGNSIAISEQRHFSFIIGSVHKLSSSLDLKPTAFLKVTKGAPVELDLTAMFIINKLLNIGAMYRTGDATGLLLGYNIIEQLYLGYSFDWSFLNATGRYNGGSHEIMLRYDFLFNNQKKIKSPRYF